ncbi:hypothetical protein V2I01_32315 [Micromonospora sp. BRA006-A]|nr:hypothetical protein [Micromonospora sp. BRA006-A]
MADRTLRRRHARPAGLRVRPRRGAAPGRRPGDRRARPRRRRHRPPSSFGYDERRHLVEVRNSSGHGTRLRYDDAGRLVRWQDRNGEWFGYDYDEAGRCVRAGGGGDVLRYPCATTTASRT